MELRLGIDIGGTKIAYGFFNKDRVIVYQHKSKTNKNASNEEFEKDIIRDIEYMLRDSGFAKKDIVGIALGFPSYVNFDKGEVIFTSNMVNLHHFKARDTFKKHFPSANILVDNDTNLAALAEHRYGAGKGFNHMVYTAISTGVGSGFIIDNKLFRGAYGGAGESGHMLITPDKGVECGCDNAGCFMSYTSGSMLACHAKNAIVLGEKSKLYELVEGKLDSITAKHINEAYQAGDGLAHRLLEQMGYYLGIYIYNMFIGLNFNCYIFGGGMMNFGDVVIDSIKATFDRYNHQKDQDVFFKKAQLKDDFGIIGAAELLY